MIFDTHAHYDDEAFETDRESILKGLINKNVGAVTNVGASMQGAKDSVALAEQYHFVYAAVGIHPDSVGTINDTTMNELKLMSRHEKVVAIGEIGLDYYWDVSDRELQKYWFCRQLSLALEEDLPVNIHSRDAAEDTLEIIKKYYSESQKKLKGIIHCYSYSVEQAKEYLSMGFYLGIGGVVTFKNGKTLKKVIEQTPLQQLVLETDSPYLSPEPYRGKRNDSSKLSYVISAIAALKGISEEEVERATWENAQSIYFGNKQGVAIKSQK